MRFLRFMIFVSKEQPILPAKPLPMEMQTPLPKIEKHSLPIGAIGQGKRLRMNETCMTVKLLFWH